MPKFEADIQCKSCGGTGLYVGLAERDGAAVVCHTCKGTGCCHYGFEYEKFRGRLPAPEPIIRVYEVNPGICIGRGPEGEFKLADFGGMPLIDWQRGIPFPPGSENRRFTCPGWWYQAADYELKPRWDDCRIGAAFSGCIHFPRKDTCWEKWDREHAEEVP